MNYLNQLPPIYGYFYKEFSPIGKPSNTNKVRKYFTANNAAKIDAIRHEIKRLKDDLIISEIEHFLLLHDLIMAVNDVANIAGTYGHYLSKFVKEPNLLYYYNRLLSQPKVLFLDIKYIGYAEEIASNLNGDICYIDPPYIEKTICS